jgi:hypothetical protein
MGDLDFAKSAVIFLLYPFLCLIMGVIPGYGVQYHWDVHSLTLKLTSGIDEGGEMSQDRVGSTKKEMVQSSSSCLPSLNHISKAVSETLTPYPLSATLSTNFEQRSRRRTRNKINNQDKQQLN